MADTKIVRASATPSAKGSEGSRTPAPTGAGAAPPTVAGFQWNRIAIIGAVVAALWVTAFATNSKIFLGIVAVLTVAVAGGLIWMYRWATKQKQMMELLQTASLSPAARKAALEKLASQDGAGKDVMNQLARAQLEAQEDPDKALVTLEGIDLKKVPGPMADDVRAFRAQLYLVNGRAREARELADDIKVSQAGSTESRGMLAATVAESWARTGKHKEAMDLLQTIRPEDPDFEKSRVPLLFARVYAAFAANQRDSVRRDLGALVRQDMNLLARFVMPKAKVHPELQKMAREVLARNPDVQRMAKRQQRVVRRPR